MAARYNLRSANEVVQCLQHKPIIIMDDVASDNEEDKESCQSDSESEEDEDDETFVSPIGGNLMDSSDESDNEIEGESQRASKRRRGGRVMSQNLAGPSRRGRKRSIIQSKKGHKWYLRPRERLLFRDRPIVPFLPHSSKLKKQARCNLCPRMKDKKVKTICFHCHRATCDEHRRAICIECLVHD